jgi:hypothetical protein
MIIQDKEILHVLLPKELIDSYKLLEIKTKFRKAVLIEFALREYLERQKESQNA